MKLTTKDIIKILPFDDSFKTDLLSQYDILDGDQKFTISRTLWDTYDTLFELKLEENLELALLRVQNGQENLDSDFYKRIEEQTEQEMQTDVTKNIQDVDLNAARKAMEIIVKEIKAAKAKTQ